ncbi:BnaC06g14950D [Brassica napus]|uniref:BnaC06g14950D protein n=1 Tax=Brassica napus TaxID=3708 RepID=A0A078F3L2_BRANA|nr:BnaC06g14950D [Brassica napus]
MRTFPCENIFRFVISVMRLNRCMKTWKVTSVNFYKPHSRRTATRD